MLDELVTGKDEIAQAGLEIAIVMQGTPEASAEFARQFAPGLLCLADPERKAYQAYGLERGNLFQTFLNLKVWSAISRSRQTGYEVEPPPPGQDAMQMSGTFIISTNGKVELPYYYEHITDHPPLDLLLSGMLSTGWGKPFDGPVGPGVRMFQPNSYPLPCLEHFDAHTIWTDRSPRYFEIWNSLSKHGTQKARQCPG